MSCYFRHLKALFEQAGIQVTTANRKEIDRIFHELVGVTYKDCPATWQRLKQELADESKRQELSQRLNKATH